MLTRTAATSTPYFCQMDGQRPIGPVTTVHGGVECEAIYGFSSKRMYDHFCSRSPSKLKPYPLVKVYLRNQVERTDAGLKLIVIDAAGLDESFLSAATATAVLEAHENQSAVVCAAYRLVFQPQTTTYLVREAFKLVAGREAFPRLSRAPIDN